MRPRCGECGSLLYWTVKPTAHIFVSWRSVSAVAAPGTVRGVRKTQYYTATSLDGYIADGNNSLDWLFEVDRAGGDDDSFTHFFAQVGAMAMGATTYEWVLDHERLLDHPEKWHAYYGETPCWVFTHRTLPQIPEHGYPIGRGRRSPGTPGDDPSGRR